MKLGSRNWAFFVLVCLVSKFNWRFLIQLLNMFLVVWCLPNTVFSKDVLWWFGCGNCNLSAVRPLEDETATAVRLRYWWVSWKDHVFAGMFCVSICVSGKSSFVALVSGFLWIDQWQTDINCLQTCSFDSSPVVHPFAEFLERSTLLAGCVVHCYKEKLSWGQGVFSLCSQSYEMLGQRKKLFHDFSKVTLRHLIDDRHCHVFTDHPTCCLALITATCDWKQ